MYPRSTFGVGAVSYREDYRCYAFTDIHPQHDINRRIQSDQPYCGKRLQYADRGGRTLDDRSKNSSCENAYDRIFEIDKDIPESFIVPQRLHASAMRQPYEKDTKAKHYFPILAFSLRILSSAFL